MSVTQPVALQALIDKLPPGWPWVRTPVSWVGCTLTPLAAEIVRFEQAAEAQMLESDPGTATLLLVDYERVLGPDSCLPAAAAVALRQLSARARWTAQGGASRAHFIGLAAALGFAVTITEYRQSQFGRKFGMPYGGAAWAHTWQVNVSGLVITTFKFGTPFGRPFQRWGNALLGCVLRRGSPAHTHLRIAYS